MDFIITLIVLAFSAIGFFVSMRIAARPADPLKPRLVSYNLMMILTAFVFILMLVHLVNLAGIKTGRY